MIAIVAICVLLAIANAEPQYPEGPRPPQPPGPFGFVRSDTIKQQVNDIGKTLISKLVVDIKDYFMSEVGDSKREVTVINDLDKEVYVRCRDKNTNAGDQLVPSKNAYRFQFDRSIFGTTHFWCDVWYDGQDKKPVHFPAYNEGAPAGNNIFAIREDGIYIRKFNKFEQFRSREIKN